MKALIMDYTDGTLLRLPIPKEWENDAEEYVKSQPCYDDSSCYYVIGGDSFDVYDVTECEDGETHDYTLAMSI